MRYKRLILLTVSLLWMLVAPDAKAAVCDSHIEPDREAQQLTWTDIGMHDVLASGGTSLVTHTTVRLNNSNSPAGTVAPNAARHTSIRHERHKANNMHSVVQKGYIYLLCRLRI